MQRTFFVVLAALSLAGCQSSYTYTPIVANAPNLEMTEARCQMLSTSTQQGYIAIGSQSYVTGAAIGNAVGNAIAADNFVRQCMAINGWRRGPAQSPAATSNSPAKYGLTGRPYKMGGAFPPKPK